MAKAFKEKMMKNRSLNNLESIMKEKYRNIAGMMIAKDDETIYEQYFNGYKEDDCIHIASVTKSIISILIGIAIDKGHIKSVNQNVMDFFPDYKTKCGEKTIQKITIFDLLTMTAPYKFKSEPYTRVYSQEDWVKAVLDLLGGKGNIGDFKYTTIGINVLSGILTSSTGMSVLDFATKYLFEPLGIEPPQNKAITNKEEFMSFIKDKYVEGWVVDFNGVNTAGWGLALKTKDLIKIGQLYVHDGMWKEKQIVSSQWIHDSTQEKSKWGELSYGYLWWVIKKEMCDGYAAIGDGGNVLFVESNQKIVIAMTSSFKPRAADRIDLICKEILPNLK